MPTPPAGNGQHPVALVVISANDLAASSAFYASVFGWQMMPMSPELSGAAARGGPAIALRAGMPEGFPGIVPFLRVPNVPAALEQVVAGGASVERVPWNIPGMGTMARFADTSGTIYGLTDAAVAGAVAPVPMPFGDNPKPPAGTVCSLEMYSAGDKAPQFFGAHFGWGTLPTMPQFVAFDPGAGIGGVFQSHTPALPAVAYIYVEDVGATLSAVDVANGARQGDPMAMPGMGTFGYFKDPSGTTMGLIGAK